MRILLLIYLGFFASQSLYAQSTCTAPGQNPETAFPVCGTSTFKQNTVPLCGGIPMPYKGCQGNGLTDINPYWYKFTCFTGGTLGFLITPNDMNDDYDWEIYDISGLDPKVVYSNASIVIANNWSGERGLTGASTTGTQQFVCGGPGKPLFSKMPTLIKNHNYLMLVSHFTRTQSGYALSFNGGTAVITDPEGPRLNSVAANCGGNILNVAISKKIKCKSIAADGTDFYITPGGASIINASGILCSTVFDADSIELNLGGFLPPGNYTLHVKKGSDGNTLFDYCDVAVPETDIAQFTILPRAATTLDSIAPLPCAPQQIKLLFKSPIVCSSIAANGSDFVINGSSSISINSASGSCAGGSTKEIILNLSAPIKQGGNFSISMKKGSDGNTILNECGEETPAGSALSFLVKDVVDASFTYRINYGCKKDTVSFFHTGTNGVNKWVWSLDENMQSNVQNPVALYSLFTTKNIKLMVSNGFCSDTAIQSISLSNFLKADFSVAEDICPNEPVLFTGMAQGAVVKHLYTFGDGTQATTANPTHTYAQPLQQALFTTSYTITDSFGCTAIVQKNVSLYASCFLAIPSAFTPNGDGLNDLFFPANAIKAEQLEFIIYNRWGQLIYKTKDWKKGWNGNLNGALQPAGIYIWMLRFTDRDTKKEINQKGTVILIR